ncbi:hormone-sensitive lipase isoform X2 [Cephus cinctus]|uniref:Hormone-sensitive lipase isoform X2 n=1 Tax=Cephus cinctus TaxID=211228 RepID=A0AAJ7RAK1_CEPCN|nr:hormone-sensitive lipase isoform X2 [Cephus cinctus]
MSFEDDFERPFEEFEPPQWGALRELCHANAEYFLSHQDESGLRIRAALLAVLDHLEQLRPIYKAIKKIAPLFDFDSQTPGNGYRSFLVLVDRCILHAGSVCRQIYSQRGSILFRKTHHMREIETCSQLLASLCTCLQHLKTLYSWSEPMENDRPSLFPSDDHSPQELLNQAENINQYCFYGRCLGFQFCDSMKRILKTISVCMASFSEAYYSNGTILGRCANSVKYILDPEARARRIVNISQRADISFCQAFWLLNESEIAQILPTMVMPSLAINQVISIPPEELKLPTENGSLVSIPIPSSHIGKKPIHVRLLSAKRRVGMVGSGVVSGELLGTCDSLIIHCHGGGFVAQSSRSHEVYLRSWAISLGVPILSIDYSLAPEAPYPRALEEVVYAYAWALKHSTTLLGSTADKVIFIGDSAGANLNLATTLRCFELNIRRPDGIFMAYTPVLVEFIPSPARLLCLTDPLLPFGFMMRCLKAYTAGDNKKNQRDKENEIGEAGKSDTESFAEVSESDLIALALSPNGDETNEEHKLASLPSDSTLNSVSLADIDGTQAVPDKPQGEAKSQEYIRKFLEMYRNSGFGNSSTMANGSSTKESDYTNGDKTWSFFGWGLGKTNKESRELDIEDSKSPSDEFVFSVPRDPLLSPYLAPSHILQRLPPIKILISKEASDGSKLCIKRIQELLDS